MEDNDKRNSSNPESAHSTTTRGTGAGTKRTGESDMFDAHEQTLPRFTIDPSDAPRQRTRTLLGVPTSMASEEVSAQPLSPPEPPPFEPAASAKPEPAAATATATAPSTSASSAILDAGEHDADQDEAPTTTLSAIDVTVDVEDDLNNEITMVNDADVVALPDNTGQLQPVRFDEPLAAAAVSSKTNEVAFSDTRPAPKVETPSVTAAASGYPNPSSLAPREVARQAKPKTESSGNGIGALLVAAVVLLATGAWFLTAGSFRRATLTEVPNRQAETAAASQPVNNMAPENPAQAPTAQPPSEGMGMGADSNAQAANNATPAPVANANNTQTGANESAAPGPALKNKPSLTATARGERTRSGKRANGKAAPAPTGDLPEGPARGEVVTRLESVRPAVHACAAGRSGVADLDITIAHTGTVMHVLVGGDFAGTTEGSCIARAVRQARFPAFKQERFRLLYPYAI